MTYRIQKSLSDLDGIDVYVHGGTVNGVLRELSNALVRKRNQPSLAQLLAVYRDLRRASVNILKQAGSPSLYSARVVRDLVLAAASSPSRHLGGADRLAIQQAP